MPGTGARDASGGRPGSPNPRGAVPIVAFLRRREGPLEVPTRVVVLLFVAISVVALTLSIMLTPPGQVPDAGMQFDRAVEVSQGSLIGLVRDGNSGDFLPKGVVTFEMAFAPIPTHPAAKVTRSELREADRSVWGRAQQFVIFGGTTEYPPFAYLPGALAVWLARIFSSRVIVAYYMLECFNAIVFVALMGWALTLFRGIATSLLAAVALLPMTIALAGSPSTDGIIIGLAAVFAGVVYRELADDPPHLTGRAEIVVDRRRGLAGWVPALSLPEWGAVCALSVAVLAKPAYFPLVLAIGAVQARQHDLLRYVQRVVPVAALMGAVLAAWYLLGARFQGAYAVAGPGVSPVAQLRFILTHPVRIAHVAEATLNSQSVFYWHSFVGILGWLDTPLESWLYLSILVAFGVLLVIRLVSGNIDWSALLCCAGAGILASALVFITLYVDWTPVGSLAVRGVQGRYFLPVAPVIIAALGVDRARVAWATVWWRVSAAAWLAMAWLAVGGASAALLGRYWLT
jgi:hypothetical protein